MTFIPQLSDHGNLVKCKSFILDGNQDLMYDSSEDQLFLDIQFQPQPKAGQLFKTEIGSDLTVNFKIKSNPMPIAKWIFQGANQETQSLNPGENTEKYETFEIDQIEDLLYQMQLQILNVSKEDEDLEYFLHVQNSQGEQLYMFEIKVVDLYKYPVCTYYVVKVMTDSVAPCLAPKHTL